jgi:hypothetical protein
MKNYAGINIQWPISRDITSGKKTIETRTYPIPEKFLNKDMALIETPGAKGKFKSRIIAIIRFTSCFKYKNKNEFYKDFERHLVDPKSPWAWADKPKFGWEVEIVQLISKPIEMPKRPGIMYSKDLYLQL